MAINMSASLQGVVIDSLYAKRLPGDVRGSMMGVKGLVNNLGHLVFVVFSIVTVDYFNSIHKSMVIVAVFDGSVFFMVMNALLFAGFDTDEFFGTVAKEKGKEDDKKLKKQIKEYSKDGKLPIKDNGATSLPKLD